MRFLQTYQLDLMLVMCGMCGILAVMTLATKSLPPKTKYILFSMEVSAVLLLFFDRISYLFRGDGSRLGFFMVRVGNGTVYVMSLVIPFFVTKYIEDLLKSEGKLPQTPKQLKAADLLFTVGVILVIVSQLTGLYYTFDEHNVYQRAPLNVLCYIIPFLIVVMQEWTIIRYRKQIKRNLAVSIIICIALPTVSSFLQIFMYGVSLINIVTALVVCVFYTYALNYLSEAAERARIREIEFYKKTQAKEAAMFRETMEALANAIDTKDKYTHGHSTRVAAYSRRIAKEAGLSEQECNQVYFAGLLHDIGKIGVSNNIINKSDKLTDGEFTLIKAHSEMGNQILSSIKQAPYLRDGAHYHHERYDGKGYPDGLSGSEIPRIARIIAVADAYDAMTSLRSYNNPLDKAKVRDEIAKCVGTHFDPEYAGIMLKLIDEGEIGQDV